MAPAPNVDGVFFPLDEELGLIPGCLTPRLQESLVRLSSWMPFERAVQEFTWHTGGHVHRETARRMTERAGKAAMRGSEAAVAAWETGTVEAPAGPETLVFFVDGAMVPLVGGEWGEVKTVAVGEAETRPLSKRTGSAPCGEPSVVTKHLSYFSRMNDNTTFGQQALDELQRRGMECAQRVGVVVDGAEWIQGFIDLHHAEAVRILDFPHAAGYVQTIGQTTGKDEATITTIRHALKHQGAMTVLPILRAWVADHPTEEQPLLGALAYLEKRVDQMDYPRFQAEGWPIGSGSVESANKGVVEARLKGAGMHWARTHVNPMLALRNAVCNDRWIETWSQIERYLRSRSWEQPTVPPPNPSPTTRSMTTTPPTPMPTSPAPSPTPLGEPTLPPQPVAKPVHPWRRAWSIRRQRDVALSRLSGK